MKSLFIAQCLVALFLCAKPVQGSQWRGEWSSKPLAECVRERARALGGETVREQWITFPAGRAWADDSGQ